MSAIDFTDNTTVVPAAWLDDVDAVVYEQTGVGKTTVASATTPDIFAVTTGRLIDYTGTATCTGFVAAVSAGSHRTLYCADACLFTAGANLLIEGIPSGTTITLAAGAIVKVYAITTTQFKMTYSVSGTFTAGCTGLTTSPTGTATYKVENGDVVFYIPMSVLGGTSNSTSFTITGLPACIQPTVAKYCGIIVCANNGVQGQALWDFDTNFSTIRLSNSGSAYGTAWTASGVKQVQITEFRYKIA